MYAFHRPYGEKLENHLAVYTRDQDFHFHGKCTNLSRENAQEQNRRASEKEVNNAHVFKEWAWNSKYYFFMLKDYPGSQVYMQLEINLTVYFALLSSLNGESRDPDEERKWGAILTTGTVFPQGC